MLVLFISCARFVTGRMGFDLDELINRLLRTAINREKNEITDLVKQEELMVLCQKARDLFMTQSTLIEVEPPITVSTHAL